MLSVIVALSKNRVIGVNNRLPWKLPDEMLWFTTITMGKAVIFGRKTYESIGKPLKGRFNIVISSNKNYLAPDCLVVNSLEKAIEKAKELSEEIFVAGGEMVYKKALDIADRLYISIVDIELQGDAFFPFIEKKEWREIWKKDHSPDKNHKWGWSTFILEKNQILLN